MLLIFARRTRPYERRYGTPFDGPVKPIGAVFF